MSGCPMRIIDLSKKEKALEKLRQIIKERFGWKSYWTPHRNYYKNIITNVKIFERVRFFHLVLNPYGKRIRYEYIIAKGNELNTSEKIDAGEMYDGILAVLRDKDDAIDKKRIGIVDKPLR